MKRTNARSSVDSEYSNIYMSPIAVDRVAYLERSTVNCVTNCCRTSALSEIRRRLLYRRRSRQIFECTFDVCIADYEIAFLSRVFFVKRPGFFF